MCDSPYPIEAHKRKENSNTVDYYLVLANSQPQPVECPKSLVYLVDLNQSWTYVVCNLIMLSTIMSQADTPFPSTALFTAHSSRHNNLE